MSEPIHAEFKFEQNPTMSKSKQTGANPSRIDYLTLSKHVTAKRKRRTTQIDQLRFGENGERTLVVKAKQNEAFDNKSSVHFGVCL
jgi:uncharacterized pyridoxal phosphate-containing UPF0001 family protein